MPTMSKCHNSSTTKKYHQNPLPSIILLLLHTHVTVKTLQGLVPGLDLNGHLERVMGSGRGRGDMASATTMVHGGGRLEVPQSLCRKVVVLAVSGRGAIWHAIGGVADRVAVGSEHGRAVDGAAVAVAGNAAHGLVVENVLDGASSVAAVAAADALDAGAIVAQVLDAHPIHVLLVVVHVESRERGVGRVARAGGEQRRRRRGAHGDCRLMWHNNN